ncbi:hypothetical protein MKW94_004253 [Papaver nudicaule]|uniref:Uncharacterized protein n=1 Tax=Papaver nudicaule TaxID=74823 RepID=A0AA42AUY1_PAPNU|nr:hypothetical protein [Papaver nudicaule]
MVKDDKMNTALASRMESVTIVEKQPGHEFKGRSSEKLLMPEQGSVGTLLRGIIEIDDSDHEKENSPDHTCKITDKEMDQFSTDATSQRVILTEHNLTHEKCLKRPLSDQRCEEYESIFEDDETLIPLSGTAKRRRITEAIISKTKSEDDVTIPVSRTVNSCGRGQKNKNSISSSRRRSVSPRQSPGKSYSANSTIEHLHKENTVDEVVSDSGINVWVEHV